MMSTINYVKGLYFNPTLKRYLVYIWAEPEQNRKYGIKEPALFDRYRKAWRIYWQATKAEYDMFVRAQD